MTNKMTVIFIKQTGQVLGAVTRSADPTGDISAEDLAGSGLLVRGLGGDGQVEVPPQTLDVATVAITPALLLQPRSFFLDADQQAPLPVSNSTVQAVTLTANDVTVQPTGTPVAEDMSVWVYITGDNLTQPQIIQGVVQKDQTNIIIPFVTLRAGDYDVLTSVSTFPLDFRADQSIP